jgi:hypothetical protein
VYSSGLARIVSIAAAVLLVLNLSFFAAPYSWYAAAQPDGSTPTYSSSYEEEIADVTKPVTVSLENHLYNRGDEIRVKGSVWTDLVRQVDAIDVVVIEVKDSNGNVVARQDATVDSEGRYSKTLSLLESAGSGIYTLESRVELDADALGIVRTITSVALQSSIQFVVAEPAQYEVNVENQDFTTQIASNSGISNFEFKQHEKKISFLAEGNGGTVGVTEVTIPKALLSGEMTVLIDQNIARQEDVIVKSNTQDETTFEINYTHSIHRIEVVGTNAVPEFPVAWLAMSAAIGAVIVFTVWKRVYGNK